MCTQKNSRCSMTLPHGAVGWSAVCQCGISRSYSLAFLVLFSFLDGHMPRPFTYNVRCAGRLTSRRDSSLNVRFLFFVAPLALTLYLIETHFKTDQAAIGRAT